MARSSIFSALQPARMSAEGRRTSTDDGRRRRRRRRRNRRRRSNSRSRTN
ncbi:hypothetical protein [Nocardioides lentus]